MMNSEADLWHRVRDEYAEKHDPLKKMLLNVTSNITSSIKKVGIKCTSRCRVKDRDSYFSKLKSQHDPETPGPILNDLLGLRIVVHFMSEVQEVVELISEKYEVIEKENKSENLSFREFSYDSTHMLILSPDKDLPFVFGNNPVIEIQVRTTLQDAWAEVEHELIYKSNIEHYSELIKRKMAALNASLTLSDIIFQEIKDFNADFLESKQQRSLRMQEKLSLLSDGELPVGVEEGNGNGFRHAGKKVEDIIAQALKAHNDGNYEKSIKLYSEAVELKPMDNVLSIVYNHRGMAYFMCSEYDNALNDFTKAIQTNQNSHRAYGNRAIIYKLYQSYEEAINDFNKSIELRHNQPETLKHLAKAYFEDSQFTNALQTINLALDLEPEDEVAQNLQKKISKKLIP